MRDADGQEVASLRKRAAAFPDADSAQGPPAASVQWANASTLFEAAMQQQQQQPNACLKDGGSSSSSSSQAVFHHLPPFTLGVAALDALLGPKDSKLIELCGSPASGKTTVLIRCLAAHAERHALAGWEAVLHAVFSLAQPPAVTTAMRAAALGGFVSDAAEALKSPKEMARLPLLTQSALGKRFPGRAGGVGGAAGEGQMNTGPPPPPPPSSSSTHHTSCTPDHVRIHVMTQFVGSPSCPVQCSRALEQTFRQLNAHFEDVRDTLRAALLHDQPNHDEAGGAGGDGEGAGGDSTRAPTSSGTDCRSSMEQLVQTAACTLTEFFAMEFFAKFVVFHDVRSMGQLLELVRRIYLDGGPGGASDCFEDAGSVNVNAQTGLASCRPRKREERGEVFRHSRPAIDSPQSPMPTAAAAARSERGDGGAALMMTKASEMLLIDCMYALHQQVQTGGVDDRAASLLHQHLVFTLRQRLRQFLAISPSGASECRRCVVVCNGVIFDRSSSRASNASLQSSHLVMKQQQQQQQHRDGLVPYLCWWSDPSTLPSLAAALAAGITKLHPYGGGVWARASDLLVLLEPLDRRCSASCWGDEADHEPEDDDDNDVDGEYSHLGDELSDGASPSSRGRPNSEGLLLRCHLLRGGAPLQTTFKL